MKKHFLFLALFFTSLIINAQNVFIYNRNGDKIYFNKVDSVTILNIDASSSVTQREIIKSMVTSIVPNIKEVSPMLFKAKFTNSQKQSVVTHLGNDTSKVYFSNLLGSR